MAEPNPFAELPVVPAEHFRVHYFAAAAHVIVEVGRTLGSVDAALAEFPFLAGYRDELAEYRIDLGGAAAERAWWRATLSQWEQSAASRLPLSALRATTDLDPSAIELLFAIGLIEEDARFGLLFESMQGIPGQHRPTLGLLNGLWRAPVDRGEVRGEIRRLQGLGLIQLVNPDAPRIEWAFQPSPILWDALRGELPREPAPWLRHRPKEELVPVEDLVLPNALRASFARLPPLVRDGKVGAVVVRGPHHNGRRTLAGAIGRALDRGVLEVSGLAKPEDERWRAIGPLATCIDAIPLLNFDLAPGETAELPRLEGYRGPVLVVLGRQGGLAGPGADAAVMLSLDLPDEATRREHLRRVLDPTRSADLDAIAHHFRMTSGNLRRAAALAPSCAALAGRDVVTLADVREAAGTLHRQSLDTLATRLECRGDFTQLAASADTLRELHILEARCRHREGLHEQGGQLLEDQSNVGVRALFKGPSGTGKTLAARILACAVGMDLYRLDLASVVNKYIGETEKNLARVFALAEELDVILLLDEGDALLTQRTGVHTANDRYANLETNYLLQRIESFEGILIVTTNAAEHIDSAFQRRMDVVVDFRPPEVAERWAIWQLHLPPAHGVEPSFLREASARCTLGGGQIRNAVLHATLLALDEGGVVHTDHLEAGIVREYVKSGAMCPLRPRIRAAAARRE